MLDSIAQFAHTVRLFALALITLVIVGTLLSAIVAGLRGARE